MRIYDPFYANHPDALSKQYDFITCTETAEHFYDPREEFKRLWDLLKPGGKLGIMTLLRPGDESFAGWHYIKDDTHVSLYSRNTFKWLAKSFHSEIEIISNRVIFLKK
jgi:2-polyprenyl-3-methyl-5-hydroxy-6-metoxy-1,4-benzoquinol methylase